MTIVEKLLRHDAWTTRQLLLRAQELSDEQLDQPFDIGPGTLRAIFTHIIANMESWHDLMAAKPQRPHATNTIPTLIARLDIVTEELVALGDKFVKEGNEEATFVDYLDNPPKQKSLATGLLHVATHGMHHRAQILYMMKKLEMKSLIEGDAFSWENANGH